MQNSMTFMGAEGDNKRRVVAAMSPLINVFFLLCFPPLFCSARDTITINNPLRDQKGETLVSVQQKYELGFFTPNGRSDNTRYLGIWYYKSRPRVVVWVANRDKPLEDSTGVFGLSKDGNLRVLDMQNKSYWSTPLTGRPFVNFFSFRRTVRLMDTGNLVLRQEDLNNNVSVSTHWQSFDYPTDTFLPDMKMSEELVLYSWVSSDDPGTGDFTFQQDEGESQYKIRNKTVRYWQNKVSGSFMDSDDEALLTFLSSPRYSDWRLVMNFTGQIQIYLWREVSMLWHLYWSAPWSPCSVYNVCGNFGSCNDGTRSLCKCLPGFEPKSLHKWNSRDFSDGCTRTSSERNKNDVFVSLKNMKVSKPDEHLSENNETYCKMACLENEKCQGYSYEFRDGRLNCWIWYEELKNIWENYTRGGRDIQIRVAVSDIETTRRNCEICGTNIIPYPLSTEPSCGDITYSSFNCSSDTGQLSFQTNTGFYSVTNIKPENRTFSILVQNAHYCTDVESVNRLLQLNQSSLFYASRGCNDDWIRPKFDGFLEDVDLKEVEIAWRPPPEPICYASKDCIDWPDSSCRASRNGNKKCQCNASFHWEPSLLNCTAGEKKPKGHTTKEKPLFLILVLITATALVISGAVFALYFLRRRRIARLRESRRRIQGNQVFRLYDSLKRVKDLISSGEFVEYDTRDIDVPLFNLESILAATNDFSDANMLGQGGFGPVYKGTFPGGQEIAIKRLSSGSGQGLQEFKNEVVLIAKLQHRNLVRLLGYCVEGGEKILLYEYMPNKSLDSFLFDRTLCVLLNWEIRFTIIMGIARGMLYLHQDSRLRIIHRDMKTSNVLLDEEMTPKISDFGLARIFGGKQSETCTKRVVGSYGYMAPEYALDGYFSIKSDVFSFGVVVLEIASGKRNTGFCQSGQTLSLLGYAWLLWKEDKASYLMDRTLSETCNQNEFLRCVNVGLLCVQEDPCDRPTMSDVLLMLGNETAHVPNPRKPAFAVRRSLSGTASSSSKLESVNELTSSLDQGR